MRPFFKKSVRSRERAGTEVSMLKHIAYGVFAMVVIGLILASFWYLSRLPALTIGRVEVVGSGTIEPSEIQSIVEESLAGSYLLIVPHRHVYFYPEEQIVERIMRIPRVRSVALAREGTVLTVSFEEYEPSALWCGAREELDGCYFLSNDGYAFTAAPPLRGSTLVRHYNEDRAPEETQFLDGATILTTERFRQLVLTELGFPIDEIMHAKNGDITYHIQGGGDLITARDVGAEETFENLKTILGSEEFTHLRPGNFEYIDLRFGLKVYVREHPVLPEVESGTSSDVAASSTSPTGSGFEN